jgi:hypothetical protein
MAIPYRKTDLSSTAVLVVGQPTFVTDVEAYNLDSADRWLHLYDAAAAADVSVGSTTPKKSWAIPAGDGTDRGKYSESFPSPIEFHLGLVIAATTTATGSTAPTNDLIVNLGRA